MTINETEIREQLNRIETTLQHLVQIRTSKEWYSTSEVAALLDKAEFTVREWCRLGRINAEKQRSGRGPHASWVISQKELDRLRREGLLQNSFSG